MESQKQKYLDLEKCENKPVSIFPSVWKKAIQLSRSILGKKNFSGIITYLINKEHNEKFGEL